MNNLSVLLLARRPLSFECKISSGHSKKCIRGKYLRSKQPVASRYVTLRCVALRWDVGVSLACCCHCSRLLLLFRSHWPSNRLSGDADECSEMRAVDAHNSTAEVAQSRYRGGQTSASLLVCLSPFAYIWLE